MFYGCSSLTSVDLSSFNTSSVTNMRNMFRGMSSSSQATITGIEDFDITSLLTNRLTNFLYDISLSTTVYDELLVNWQGQTGYNNQNPNFGSSTYTAGSAAATARAALITAGWSITDGGTA
jgi:surface protein